jgi:hypothetical protein
MGFGLVTRFINHLYTRLGTTSNYSATDNLHNLSQHPLCLFQLTVSLPAVPWQRLLTVEILQLHALRSTVYSLPYRIPVNCQLNSNAPIVFFLTIRHWPHRKHGSFSYANRFRGNVFASPSNGLRNTDFQESAVLATGFVKLFVSAGTCSTSRCPETNFVSEPFASKGCLSGSTVLAIILKLAVKKKHKYLQTRDFRVIYSGIHGSISQKIKFFIKSAARSLYRTGNSVLLVADLSYSTAPLSRKAQIHWILKKKMVFGSEFHSTTCLNYCGQEKYKMDSQHKLLKSKRSRYYNIDTSLLAQTWMLHVSTFYRSPSGIYGKIVISF